MKFSGTKDLDIALDSGEQTVQLTMRYATAYEAVIAYEEITRAAKDGKLKLNISLGEVLEHEGPQLG